MAVRWTWTAALARPRHFCPCILRLAFGSTSICKDRLVLDPTRIFVPLAGGRNDRGVDKRPGLDCHGSGFELSRHGLEQRSIKAFRDQLPTIPDEGSTLRRRFICGKPTKATERSTIIKGFGQVDLRSPPAHVGQIAPDRKQQCLEHRQRRPGRLAFGGPIERIKKRRDRTPIDQLLSSSSDDRGRAGPAKPNRS